MVKRIFGLLNKEMGGLHDAAYLLGFFTILSQLLALFRDRLFANQFGAGRILDVYYASFRIPDFIFISLASFVSISVLVPFLVDKMKGGTEDVRRFIDSIFSFFILFIIIVSVVVYYFVPELVGFLIPGLASGDNYINLISLTRIMLLSPILLGISNFLASITQTFKRFVIYAISPLLYNIGIIIGIIVFYPLFGIKGLAYGVVLGALCHLVVQIPFVWQKGLLPRVYFFFNFKSIREVVFLSLTRTFALSTSHIATIFLIAFGSFMAVGSVAIFNLSWNMQSVPLAIVGASYSIALFPTMSKLFGDGNREKFVTEMATAARHIVFWSIPVSILFVVLRAQIVRTILGAGRFSWSDTRLTAAALAIFSLSVVAQSLSLLLVRAYYASGKTKIPLMVNAVSGLLIILLSYTFWRLLENWQFFRYFIETLFRVGEIEGTEVLSLPIGYTIASIINTIALWAVFHKEHRGFTKPVLLVIFQTFSASVIMGLISYLCLNAFNHVFDLTTGFGIFMQGLLSGLIGITSGIFVLLALGNKEIKEIWSTLHDKIWKTKVIVPEQESL